MKRSILVFSLCAVILSPLTAHLSPLQAQIVKEQEQAVVYYMPKTELVFIFRYEKVVKTAGIYAAYAEEMLGIKDAIQDSETSYRLLDVQTGTRSMADPERVYKVVAQTGLNTQSIALTQDGRLCGYNVSGERKAAKGERLRVTGDGLQVSEPQVIPYMEADLRTESTKERAQRLANQIFQIRETRMFLLAGEVDHAPADGQAMERVLNELHQQEEVLVALFAGKVEVEELQKEITFYPTQSEEVVLANFSTHNGFGSGESLILTLAATKQVKTLPAAPVEKKGPQPSQIYYNLPGSVHYSLVYRDQKWAEKTVEIPQLGVAVPLSMEIFKKNVHIHINTQTGNIQSIYE